METPLPQTAQAVAEVIGREATLALAGKCQYRNCNIPRNPVPDDHWIVRAIGRKKTVELQAVFGGELIPLARCYAVHAAERDTAIRAAASAGRPVHQIASDFSVSPATVRRVIHPEQAERNRVATLERHRNKTSTASKGGGGVDTFRARRGAG